MKRLLSLLLAIILIMAGCGRQSPDDASRPEEPSREASEPEASPEESSQPEESEEEEREPKMLASGTAQEITGLAPGKDWRLQHMTWLEEDQLLGVFADGGPEGSSGSAVNVQVILFDVALGTEATVITLKDAEIRHVTANESVIQLFDANTVYALGRYDYSFMGTAPSAGQGFGSVSGAYGVERDETGLVLRDYTGLNEDLPVMADTAEHTYRSPVWSPDGSRFFFSRYLSATEGRDGIVIAARSGEILQEIDLPEAGGSFAAFWSGDSKSVVVDEGGRVSLYSPLTGKAAGSAASVESCMDAWGSDLLCVREAGENSRETYLHHADRGTATSLLVSSAPLSARFSPGGRRVAVMDPATGMIYLFPV